jgi:hypothetical protein
MSDRSSRSQSRAKTLSAFLILLFAWCPTTADAIVITEIHYHPAGSGDLSRRLEYIEIYNEDSNPRDLTDFAFVQGVEFVFRERIFLDGYAYLVVCADEDLIRAQHGITNTIGNWSSATSLDNGGERVSLANPAGKIVASVRFNDVGRWPAGADGTGHSLALIDPYTELDDPDHWTLSVEFGGTPGVDNFSGVAESDILPRVVFNEAFVVTSGARWVEFYNRGDSPVDLSGYHVTTSRELAMLGTLPDGTVVAARDWVDFEDTALGLDFSIPEGQDRLFVALVNPEASRVLDAYTLRPNLLNLEVSQARVPDGRGDVAIAADPTRGAANGVTVENRIVINEINYNSIHGDPDREFIELFHHGEVGDAVDLGGWRIADGVTFDVPVGTNLAGGEYLLVARDPALIRSIYELPESVQVLGPAADDQSLAAFGTLRNGGERVTVMDARGNVADTVRYFDGGEWSRWPDGGGSTLELIDAGQENDCAQAWDASDDSDKAESRDYDYTGIAYSNNAGDVFESEIHVLMLDRGIALVDDLYTSGRATTELVPEEMLIDTGDEWTIFKGVEEPPSDWKELDFDDGSTLFVRGDCNGDGSNSDVSDALRVLTFNFLGGVELPCVAACDADGDGEVFGVVTDAIYMLVHQILGGPPPPAPFGECGPLMNPGDLALGCADSGTCGAGTAGWLRGPTPIGYGEADLGTVLSDMRFGYASFYARRVFEAGDLERETDLFLEMDFDDGYVAYLNGIELRRSNLTSRPPPFDEEANDRNEAGDVELHNITSRADLLRPGRNVLAVQLHNRRVIDADAYLSVRMFRGRVDDIPEGWNRVPQGDFETELGETWLVDGNHQSSGQTTDRPISGSGSLKVVALGAGNHKVNRLETELAQPTIPDAGVRFSLKGRWVVGSPGLLTKGFNYGHSRAHSLHVPERLGTPGAPNSVTLRQQATTGTTNLGPVIDRVSQMPVLPAPGQDVTVHARIRDPDGLSGVTLRYAVNSVEAPFTALEMSGPDLDGLHWVVVPGQGDEQRVVFEIVAEDAGNRSGRFPLNHIERTHPLVLDPDKVVAADSRWAIYGHKNFEPSSSAHQFHFWMHEENERGFERDRLQSNYLWEGSFVFNDSQIYYGAGFRAQGSPILRAKFRNSRVRFPDDNPLFGRFGRFNLDGDGTDVKEMLINYIIRNNSGGRNVPFISHTWAQWSLNDRDIGLRQLKVPPGRTFISEWYANDDRGDLFELDERYIFTDSGFAARRKQAARWMDPPYTTDGAPGDKEAYRHHFNLRMDKGRDRFTNLITTGRFMDPNRTPNSSFDNQLEDHLDVEEFFRVLIVRQNTGDLDTWATIFGKSAYLYRPDVEARWHLIPWDGDISWGTDGRRPTTLRLPLTPGGVFEIPIFDEVQRMLSRPRFQRRYMAILKEMTDDHFNLAYLAPYVAKLRAAGASNGSLAHVEPGGFLEERLALNDETLSQAVFPGVDFSIGTNGGDALTVAGDVVTLEGTAPVEVRFVGVRRKGEVLVDAPDVVFSNTDFFGWSLPDVPLLPGLNELELFGLDHDGEVVDGATIMVTSE